MQGSVANTRQDSVSADAPQGRGGACAVSGVLEFTEAGRRVFFLGGGQLCLRGWKEVVSFGGVRLKV
jgi:hypothetical protein